MAAPSYDKDLVDVTTADGSTGFAEPTATGWTSGGTPTQDSDYPYIQGSSTYNSALQAATKTGIAAMLFDNGSGITIPTDGAILVWHLCYTTTVLDTYENGGMRVMVGSSLADFKSWDVGGSNAGRMPYGGWQNWAVNPTVSADDTLGAPSGTLQYVGAAISLTAGVGKGYPNIVDAIRYGRCEARFYGGDSGDPATFAGFAALNDAAAARWGLIQAISGGFLWKGLMTLGYGAAVYFTDQNKVIFIDDTRKVTVNFNKIEIDNSSTVNWTNMLFICTSPSTTASRGRLEVISATAVNLDGCTFTDMDTFVFDTTCSILGCTFRRCNEITSGGADFNGTFVATPTVAADGYGFIWDQSTDPDGYLDNMIFSKGTNAHHAIYFGSSIPSSISLRGITFSGFNASDSQNDSTLYFADSAGTITVYLYGCSGNISYKSAGCTVIFIQDSVTVTVVTKKADGSVVGSARVFLAASDALGPFPFEESVTIVNSGTTATVTHTGHGLLTNDKVWIQGASHWQNNGVFTITKTSDNEYTYTMPSDPGSSPTGTITCTFVVIEGTSDPSTGIISMSRVFSDDQNVSGWARKSSSDPYYKEGPIGGTVDFEDGASFTAILALDQ
jgi:hypothetical protein